MATKSSSYSRKQSKIKEQTISTRISLEEDFEQTRPDLLPILTENLDISMSPEEQEQSFDVHYQLLHALDTRDLPTLRKIGIETGFYTPSLRKKIWPLLLKVPTLNSNSDMQEHEAIEKIHITQTSPSHSKKAHSPHSYVSPTRKRKRSISLPKSDPISDKPTSTFSHPYSHQISLDIKRSFSQFQNLIHPTIKSKKQKQLELILNQLFSEYTCLHYYQGWHDIGAVLLMVLNDVKLTKHLLERVAVYFLRDAMHSSLEPIMFQMLILLPILKREQKSVYQLFEDCQLHPYFCLSWIITWFAHDLKQFDLICRIFDFCFSINPILPIYMSTALVLMNSDSILEQEPDYAMLHHFISNLPSQSDTITPSQIDTWLYNSVKLYEKYPLKTIEALTGWKFDTHCTSLRFDQDFLSSPFPLLSISTSGNVSTFLDPLMLPTVSFPKDTLYTFKPLALVRRVGKTYVLVDGDVTKFFVLAMAVGLIGITLSSTSNSTHPIVHPFYHLLTDSTHRFLPTLLHPPQGEEVWTNLATMLKNMVLSLIFR